MDSDKFAIYDLFTISYNVHSFRIVHAMEWNFL